MNTKSYKHFAELCEAYVNEASTAMNLITGKSGGEAVIKHLHKNLQLAHDLAYKQIDKISWSDLKGNYRGAWVVIIGANGVGAIKSRGDTYEAVASTADQIETASDSRGGNVIDFLKGQIGKLQKFYVASNTSAVKDKKKQRADQQSGTTQEVSKETLMKKFRPLFVKATNAAIADIKGHIANQIKNDAFEKAKQKIELVSTLQTGVERLEGGDTDTPGFVERAINSAILMAASYHYPEQTGNLERNRYGGGLSAQFTEGPKQLLQDITQGDNKKLGTVLTFFKRSLISG